MGAMEPMLTQSLIIRKFMKDLWPLEDCQSSGFRMDLASSLLAVDIYIISAKSPFFTTSSALKSVCNCFKTSSERFFLEPK